jgi:hypothetical protein
MRTSGFPDLGGFGVFPFVAELDYDVTLVTKRLQILG